MVDPKDVFPRMGFRRIPVVSVNDDPNAHWRLLELPPGVLMPEGGTKVDDHLRSPSRPLIDANNTTGHDRRPFSDRKLRADQRLQPLPTFPGIFVLPPTTPQEEPFDCLSHEQDSFSSEAEQVGGLVDDRVLAR